MTNIFLVVINGGSGEELCSYQGGWRSQLEGGPRAMEIRLGFHRKIPTCHRFPQGPILGLSPACPSAPPPLTALPPCPVLGWQTDFPSLQARDRRTIALLQRYRSSFRREQAPARVLIGLPASILSSFATVGCCRSRGRSLAG